MTPRSSGSQKTRKLSPEEEAFASWFVKWWQRRGGHIDLSANPVPANEKKSSAVSEIEIWREPQNRLDAHIERGTNGLEPASIDETGDLQAK